MAVKRKPERLGRFLALAVAKIYTGNLLCPATRICQPPDQGWIFNWQKPGPSDQAWADTESGVRELAARASSRRLLAFCLCLHFFVDSGEDLRGILRQFVHDAVVTVDACLTTLLGGRVPA